MADIRSNSRLGAIIIAANFVINGGALLGYNWMRQTAMRRAAEDRATISRKLDAAWEQRVRLTAATVKACQR